MSTLIDLFWSFRSPYSYLATPGAVRLEADYDVQIRFRPVLPLAVRDPAFFSPDNVKRGRYIGLDWVRRAQMLGMAHRWPSPDPIVQDLRTYRIAAEQPYIHRLTRLFRSIWHDTQFPNAPTPIRYQHIKKGHRCRRQRLPCAA